MQFESNKNLYKRLFGRGWAMSMVRAAAMRELVKRAQSGDREAANYLSEYEEQVTHSKRSKQPRLFIKYRFKFRGE